MRTKAEIEALLAGARVEMQQLEAEYAAALRAESNAAAAVVVATLACEVEAGDAVVVEAGNDRLYSRRHFRLKSKMFQEVEVFVGPKALAPAASEKASKS